LSGRVRITHPERVLDPTSGTRKIDLARYWQWVAPWLLPDLKGRPVSLVRAPGDITGELFFQKHAERREIPFVTQHPGLDPGMGRCCRSTASMRCSARPRWARSNCIRGTRMHRTSSGPIASCSTSIPIRRCRGAR
jgi:hypothetical protein